MLLGSSSAKKNTITVSTRVVAATASVPHRRAAITVVMEDARMWERLLPMRMVDRALSKWSRMYWTFLAPRSPLSARRRMRILLTELRAISLEAK